MFDLWTDLIGCLDLHLEHERSEADDVTVFEGVSQQLDYHRVFGGQLLGQFIRAADDANTFAYRTKQAMGRTPFSLGKNDG